MSGGRPTKHRGTRAQRLSRSHWIPMGDFFAMKVRLLDEAIQLAALHGEPFVSDHIYPIFGKTVSGLSVPSNMQVLSWALNARKKNKLPGQLAHELWDPTGADVFHSGEDA